MAVIQSGSFAKALWPGINAWYGKAYDEHRVEYSELFDKFTSTKQYEEDVGISSFGMAPIKPEGSSIAYDEEKQGFVTRYTHVEYALGFIITEIMMEDDQYDVVGQRRARGLAFSMRQTKETVAANVYNRAFNASYTFGDGSALLVNDHPNVAGGTWSNILTTASSLSEAALEQACIDLMAFTNDRGLKISIMPRCLIVHPNDVFNAERILRSPLRSGTSDNDLLALKSLGKFPEGIKVNHYLTDSNAWFIRTNSPDGMKHFERRSDRFEIDNDFDTSNAKFKSAGRYSFGNSDPRGLFGSPGA